MKKNLFLFLMIILPSTLVAQNVTVTNLQVTEGTPSTVTFDVSWEKPAPETVWMDSAWVFVDYNKAGKMTRLLISGGTLTSHTANTGASPDAGKLIILTGNDRGAWATGDAWKQGNFSAEVMLLSDEEHIAGACAYASGYPPVSNWLSDTKLGFTGTPMYEITLTDGSTTVTVEAGSTFLLPCSYTVSSFTDATGAPGIIKCLAPTGLTLATPFTTVCPGESVILTASATGAASYSINGTDWQASPVFNVAPTSTTHYTLYAQTEEGCVTSVANAAVVTVNPLPADLTLTAAPTAICAGASSTLTASATNGYEFSINNSTWQTTTVFNVTPTSTTPYTLYVKTTASCLATKTNAASVAITPKGGNNQAATACGCATGLIDCCGTCTASSSCKCTTWTTCSSSGFTMISSVSTEGKMNLKDANTLCINKGMRLPTATELGCMCSNKNTLPGGYEGTPAYWSYTKWNQSDYHVQFFNTCNTNGQGTSNSNNVKCVKN
jgi:hypothetical protein